MVSKTVFMLSVYTLPFIFLIFGNIESTWLMLMLYTISGLGLAGIGMAIMHDANHGAYTKFAGLNRVLALTLEYLGCSSKMWKFQHNVLHHTYTNIHGHDEDINAPLFLLRFSAYNKRYKIHRFQHLYIWVFYSIMTLYWVTVKDFRKVIEYRDMGFIKPGKEVFMSFLELIPIKLIYFTYSLVLPIMFLNIPAIWVIVGFVLMHLVSGILLSVIFQMAHVVPNMEFPQADENLSIKENWYTHQLKTTSNFAPNNRVLAWLVGGLTYQIEHHLFPNICHVHYRNISKIVQKTAIEYGIPYHVNTTFWVALRGHIGILREMGVAKQLEATDIK